MVGYWRDKECLKDEDIDPEELPISILLDHMKVIRENYFNLERILKIVELDNKLI